MSRSWRSEVAPFSVAAVLTWIALVAWHGAAPVLIGVAVAVAVGIVGLGLLTHRAARRRWRESA